MYIKPLSAIIDSHSIIHHSFADDLQLQMSAPPDRISELLHSMQSCISDVKAWATANMLKLNDSKTELMLLTSKRSKHLHNLPTSITIGNAQIPFKQSVKNLGFTLDCHLTMNALSSGDPVGIPCSVQQCSCSGPAGLQQMCIPSPNLHQNLPVQCLCPSHQVQLSGPKFRFLSLARHADVIQQANLW